MTIHTLRKVSTIDQIVQSYTLQKASIENLAEYFQCSNTTIRRILAEKGVLSIPKYKTDTEAELLTYLKSIGIDSIRTAKMKLISPVAAKNLFNTLPPATQIEWLYEASTNRGSYDSPS